MDTGVHHTLFNDLCADEKKFFNYFRMSKPSFEELLSYVRRDITGTTTNIENAAHHQAGVGVTEHERLASGQQWRTLVATYESFHLKQCFTVSGGNCQCPPLVAGV